jgi:hypothetical protein
VIRIDALWLAVQPIDMRAGADRLLARVVQVFGAAQAHHGYVFANARANQTTFSIPIIVCGDRVPMAPAPRQEGPALSTGGQEGPASRPR